MHSVYYSECTTHMYAEIHREHVLLLYINMCFCVFMFPFDFDPQTYFFLNQPFNPKPK